MIKPTSCTKKDLIREQHALMLIQMCAVVWLSNFEANMRNTLKKAASDGMHTYGSQPRCEWIFQQPGQLVPAISQVFWCQQVTAALSGNSASEELRGLRAEGVNKLDDLAELVSMALSPMHRRVVVALITVDVHNRDVLSRLSQGESTTPSDFTWQMQLRCAAHHVIFQIIQTPSAHFGVKVCCALSSSVT
jgi:hypothetical protein